MSPGSPAHGPVRLIGYFGYGSLVNAATLRTPHVAAHRATLRGWRRRWLSRPSGVGPGLARTDLAFLSVVPDGGTAIEGLVVVDHLSSLASLDEREALYERRDAHVDCGAAGWHHPDPPRAFLYVADEPPAREAFILRSYLDAVMQGYLTQFGEAGLRRFVETTDGFELPLLEDRESPVYPRHVATNASERAQFDALVPPRSPANR